VTIKSPPLLLFAGFTVVTMQLQGLQGCHRAIARELHGEEMPGIDRYQAPVKPR
jgi:hypothetical protein